jgi:membrane protein DedA with SNARE-associated domain
MGTGGFDMFHQVVVWLVDAVGQWGYSGIVMLMALESSFFPFPSEVVIPPAAYLAASGKMNIAMVIFCGTLGSLLGAVFNYWIALKFGRPFFVKYGRYLLVSPKSMEKADRFFERHGHISTFVGRLLPGIRQYISLPAGVARMNVFAFCAATALGAGIWVLVLAGMGYWFGRNEQLVLQNLHWVTLFVVVGCGVIVFFYWRKWQSRSRLKNQLRQ